MKMTSLKFRVVRIRLFPTLISKIKSLGTELHLTAMHKNEYPDMAVDGRFHV